MADFSVKVRMPGVRVNQASGTIDIHSNGVYDVADFAEANVSVSTEIPDGSVTMAKLATDVRANVANVPVLDGKVEGLEESATDLWEAVDSVDDRKQDKLTFDNAPNRYSDNPVKSSGIYNALSGKQNALTFDTTPTGWSNNPVTSHGIYVALQGKQETLTFDQTPASGSFNPVTSEGISLAIDMAQSTVEQELQAGLATKQDVLTFDNVPMAGSNNPVKSGGVYGVVSELTSLADKKAPVITETASGKKEIVFYDGADAVTAKSFILKLDPIQDLNGYDKPWPAGAGPAGAPNSNICPISANEETGAIIDFVFSEIVSAYQKDDQGRITFAYSNIYSGTGQATYNVLIYRDGILTENMTVDNPAYSNHAVQGASGLFTVKDKGSGAYIRPYIKIDNDVIYGRQIYVTYNDVVAQGGSVEYPKYTSGTTHYPIAWRTEAGGVYGAEIDAVGGILIVTHDMVTLTANSNWKKRSSGGFYVTVPGVKKLKEQEWGAISMCRSNVYAPTTWLMEGNFGVCVYGGYEAVIVFNNRYTTVDDFKASITEPIQVVYPLETPRVYQFTPVDIKTFLGENNIRVDAPGDVEITYYADTKLYIDKKIAQLNA